MPAETLRGLRRISGLLLVTLAQLSVARVGLAQSQAPSPAPVAQPAAADVGTAPTTAGDVEPPMATSAAPPAPDSSAPPAPASVAPVASAPAAPAGLTERPTASALVAGVFVTGFVQADYTNRQSSVDEINYSSGDPLNENRFLIRRARLGLALDRPYVEGIFELDGNTLRGATARVVRAEATVRLPGAPSAPPLVAFTIGLFKTPFGFEVVQSDRDRFFAERSTASRALFPGEYDLGARLAGGFGPVRYAVAAVNGDPLGEKAFPGRDPNAAKDLVGRVGVDLAGSDYALYAGVSMLRGRGLHRGTAGTKDVLVWRDYNENGVVDAGEMQVILGQAPQPSSTFARSGLGADLRLTFPVPLLGKAVVASEVWSGTNLDRGLIVSDPVAASRDLRQLGYSASWTQSLGAGLTVGVRYDRYDPDRDAQDSRGGKVVPSSAALTTLALAGEWRIDRYRLLAEYDVNRNHQGRDAQGRPSSLADNLVLVRGEVDF